MTSLRTSLFALLLSSIVAAPEMGLAQPAGGYTTPRPFMKLYCDFTGSNEPDYPAGQPTIGLMLTQDKIHRLGAAAAGGPLVLVSDSDI